MSRYKERKAALRVLNEIENNPSNYYLIHYACDDFNKSDIISNISIMNFGNQNIVSFSIRTIADELRVPEVNIHSRIAKIQKELLTQFNDFIKSHPDAKWIHWNMNNDIFGFGALHRISKTMNVNDPVSVTANQTINLSHLLSRVYGPSFCADPRMESLARLNKLDLTYEYKNYSDEINLLHQSKYREITRSTNRKLTIFRIFLERAINRKLVVNSSWRDIYGVSFQGCYDAVKDKWWFAALTFIAGIIIGHFF